MTMSWRKNDGARAKKLREEASAQADKRQVDVVKTAIRQVKEEQRQEASIKKAFQEGRPIN